MGATGTAQIDGAPFPVKRMNHFRRGRGFAGSFRWAVSSGVRRVITPQSAGKAKVGAA
jgi:hypothetical protein